MSEVTFPTEEVNLPSKGLYYDKSNPLSSGKVEIKYMTAKEEDILTSINLIRKGTVIDKVLEALIVDKKIKIDDLLVGDKNGLVIATRILAYGKNYEIQAFCDDCQEVSQLVVDCTKLSDKEISTKTKENKFSMELPRTKVRIEFKLLTSGEEKLVEKDVVAMQKAQPDHDYTNTFRFKRMITSVDGDTKQTVINDFVDNKFLAQDSLAFRKHLQDVTPDVNMGYPFECVKCDHEQEVTVPLGTTFLWPDTSQ